MRSDRLILSCEHATARVPAAFRHLFASRRARSLLATHRGFDVGALQVAKGFERRFGKPLYRTYATRLLVDTNRSLQHPGLFSEFSRRLSKAERQRVLQVHYVPYRLQVEAAVREGIGLGHRVVHLSLHSFTPNLDGNERNADVGLLYDPARAGEARLAATWRAALLQRESGLRVRRNYPYRGTADGLTCALRRSFSASRYVGLEVEVSQRFFLTSEIEAARHLIAALVSTFPIRLGEGVTQGRGRDPR